LQLGAGVYFVRTSTYWKLYIKKTAKGTTNHQIVNDTVVNNLSAEGKFELSSGEYKTVFEQAAIKPLIERLWAEYKLHVSLKPEVFESMKENFNLDDKSDLETKGTDALLSAYETELEDYTNTQEQEYKRLNAKELKKLSDLERELYEAQRENARLKLIKGMYNIYSSAQREVKERAKRASN